ncbi:hypothetical protein ACVBE9_00325 [Eionea flava]
MHEIWFYSVYPLVVSVICCFLYCKAWKSGAASEYLRLFSNLTIINLCQVAIYLFIPFYFVVAEYIADFYLIAAYFLFAHLLQLSLSLSETYRGTWPRYIYIVPVVLTVMHLLGLMVESYRIAADGTILHNDGTHSIYFDVFGIVACISTIVIFGINVKTVKDDYVNSSRNLIALLSFVPFILGAVYLIVRSNTDNPVSVVYVVPTMTLWIALVFYYISKGSIVDLTLSPQGHIERFKLMHLGACHIDTPEQRQYYEDQRRLHFYKEKLRKHNFHYPTVAKEAGVGDTTVRTFIKKHDLAFYKSTRFRVPNN